MSKKQIIIHCIGRVGSTGIYMSLRDQYPPEKRFEPDCPSVMHTHFLQEKYHSQEHNRTGFLKTQFNNAQAFHTFHADHPAGKRLVISGVRDPIARVISGIFYVLHKYFDDPDQIASHEDILNVLPRKAACYTDPRWLLNQMFTPKTDAQRACTGNWFQTEFETLFGAQLSQFTTVSANGHATFTDNNTTYIFYTLEYGLNHIQPIIEQWCALPEGTLKSFKSNSVDDKSLHKPYSNHAKIKQIYDQTRAAFSLPNSTLEAIYSDPYYTTFYSKEQREALAQNWRQ